ncbi:unnamed protein product [Schistocephalus solidus]|uniref:ASXH domain-containing protein n=1 Tax=Schistocephalus solidus TaxID=70667 RepID=A0A183SR94_SCHSO|nr:unnamed protein product [Schistocephalus solidus]
MFIFQQNLINKENFEALPLESKRKLIQLLPIYDRVRPPPGINLGDEAGEVVKPSNCDGNAGDGDTAASVSLLWVHPTALNNEFLSKALQDYSARQLNGEFAPRQNGRSGLRKTVGNRSRYPGLPVSPIVAAATATISAATNTSSSFQNGTPKPAPVSTPLSPPPSVNSFVATANTTVVTNLTRDETDTLFGASAGIDQSIDSVALLKRTERFSSRPTKSKRIFPGLATTFIVAWESVPKAGSANLLPGLRNNDLDLVETAVRPDRNLSTDIKPPTLPSSTAVAGTIASSVRGAGNRKGTNGVKKHLTKGQLKRPGKTETEEKGQPADTGVIQRITTRLSRKRKASAPAAVASIFSVVCQPADTGVIQRITTRLSRKRKASAPAAVASIFSVVCETKDEAVFSTSTSSSPSRPGALLLPSKLFRIDTRQRRRFASTTTVPCNRPASLADDELDDEDAEEVDDQNEGPCNATQSPSTTTTTTTSEGYSPVGLENRKLSFSPVDTAAGATAACVVSGKGNSSRIDWPTKPSANAVVTPSRRLNSCQDTKTPVFSTPRGSTSSKSTKDREASVGGKSELGSSQPSTLEMPPPRQTKTLASVREKLRAKRMLLENQRSSPHPPLGSLTPNPGLSHTGNFYSSPFYRQPLTSPSTVSSSCLSSSQLTALNIDAQFSSQPPTQQSTSLSKFAPPLTSVASALDSLDNLSQNMASTLDLFTSKTVVLPQQQHQLSSQPQQLSQQQQTSDTGFPQSVSAPATPHHERQTDRMFAPRSTISTPAGSRSLSSQASPIPTSQSAPSINSKVVQLFSSLRQARVVLAPSCSVSNSSRSSDVEVSATPACASFTELEVSPPLTVSTNGAETGSCEDTGTAGCAGQSCSGAKPNPTVLCAPPSKTSPLQPAVTTTTAPPANGTATTRAFFVDGNNLSETLALLQSMNPQATVTQQQFLLIPSSDRSFMYLWRTPLSGCLKSVQQPMQHQLHQQVQQPQIKVESIELPVNAGPHCVVSSSANVLPEVTAKVDSSGRQTVVSYPSLVQTKHQQPSVDIVDGRRSSLTLPLILPATQPPTPLSSSSRGLVSDLPIASQPQLKPSVTTAVVPHAPPEPSPGYREILPSPIEGKTLITTSRPAPGTACSSTGLVMQSSTRLPQLAPNDQRRVGLFYQQQQQHHFDVIPGPPPRQTQQQQQQPGTSGTTTTTFILNTSGGTPVSLVERNIVISSNHLRGLPAGVTAFPVSFQPAASVPPPLPHGQQSAAITSTSRLVAQPLQPKENLH